jgi:hypothetical protein
MDGKLMAPSPTSTDIDDQTRQASSVQFAEMWDAIAELKRCCAAIPDSDATGKLRGKLWRLETSLREAEQAGDATTFRSDAKSAEELVRRIHHEEPLSRFLDCLSALNARIGAVA